jgi:hypothetical protein
MFTLDPKIFAEAKATKRDAATIQYRYWLGQAM